MPKKKKSALKPVVRGFATTSIPKKVVEEATPEKDEDPIITGSSSVEPDTVETTVPIDTTDNLGDFDIDKAAEEQSLQNLVDKFQEKTEKEILRTIKVMIATLLSLASSNERLGHRIRPTSRQELAFARYRSFHPRADT